MQEMITRSPRGKLAYRPAHLGNRPDTFVPEDPSVGHHRDIPLQDVQVSAADRGGVHLHDHVSRVNDLRGSRLFPGVNDSGRRLFSITTKISRRDPRTCPHENHPQIVYTPRSTRCSPPVTTWRPPWSRWRGSVPSCCCRPRWRRRSPASSAGTATPARPVPRAPRPVSATATARPR